MNHDRRIHRAARRGSAAVATAASAPAARAGAGVTHARRTAIATLALALCAVAQLRAQIPDAYSNLRVLPKDIAKPELIRTMRSWASDLGVRCHHCHVGPENLQGMDFATDSKPTKVAAREMIRMVRQINSSVLAALPPRDERRQEVGCYTCHRGAQRPPVALDQELARVAEARGADAAVAHYRSLRSAELGAGRYDFGPRAIGAAAMRLVEAGRPELALPLARLNAETHAEEPLVHVALGELLLRAGERAAAAASYREALALDPENPAARRGLARAEGEGDP